MKQIRLLRPIIHFLLINLSFFLVYRIRLFTDLIPGVQLPIPLINSQELIIFALISAVLFLAIGIIKKFYTLNKVIPGYFKTFSKTWIYWFVFITFISYFGQGFVFLFGISRFIIILGGALALLLILIFDGQWRKWEHHLQIKQGKKILIISNETIDSYEVLKNIKKNFSLPTEFVLPSEFDDQNIQNYEILVAVGNFEKEVLQELFEKVRFHGIRFFHISEGLFLEDVVYQPEMIQNIIALEYTHSKLDGWSLILKRIFDLVGSTIGIILLSPLLLLISIIIKIDSRGPVIYKSQRVGKGEKLFTFLKFRTMYREMSVWYGGEAAEKMYEKLIQSDANTRKGILPKIDNDPRVTRVGKFLRKTSLDELPQLFSVWIGTMSLIGPRPHLPKEVEQYQAWQKRLLSIKPGITGYAQVFGRDSLDFTEEAKLDLYYIQNWSLWLDIYVLFTTFGVVFKGR